MNNQGLRSMKTTIIRDEMSWDLVRFGMKDQNLSTFLENKEIENPSYQTTYVNNKICSPCSSMKTSERFC